MATKVKTNELFDELDEQLRYATRILGTARLALFESKIGKQFGGKPPRPVIMHALSRGLTDCEMPDVDDKKFLRGLISLCLFYLEDKDVELALKIKEELSDTDKE